MMTQIPKVTAQPDSPTDGVLKLRRLVVWSTLLVLAAVMLTIFGRHALSWKVIDMALGVVSGPEFRLFDVRTELGPPFIFWVLWVGGLVFACFAKPRHFQWVILLSVLFSPTVAAHDLIYLLVLIPCIENDYALVVVALAPYSRWSADQLSSRFSSSMLRLRPFCCFPDGNDIGVGLHPAPQNSM